MRAPIPGGGMVTTESLPAVPESMLTRAGSNTHAAPGRSRSCLRGILRFRKTGTKQTNFDAQATPRNVPIPGQGRFLGAHRIYTLSR